MATSSHLNLFALIYIITSLIALSYMFLLYIRGLINLSRLVLNIICLSLVRSALNVGSNLSLIGMIIFMILRINILIILLGRTFFILLLSRLLLVINSGIFIIGVSVNQFWFVSILRISGLNMRVWINFHMEVTVTFINDFSIRVGFFILVPAAINSCLHIRLNVCLAVLRLGIYIALSIGVILRCALHIGLFMLLELIVLITMLNVYRSRVYLNSPII